MVSSRKEENVKNAVEQLKRKERGTVEGVVCHVGKSEHRSRLIEEVWKIWCVFCAPIQV